MLELEGLVQRQLWGVKQTGEGQREGAQAALSGVVLHLGGHRGGHGDPAETGHGEIWGEYGGKMGEEWGLEDSGGGNRDRDLGGYGQKWGWGFGGGYGGTQGWGLAWMSTSWFTGSCRKKRKASSQTGADVL